jgi:hypothetical protein
VKAWGRLSVAAGAVLIALAVAAGASANRDAQPRHVEFRPAHSRAFILLGTHGGYELGLAFEEPDFAILYAGHFDPETQSGVSTAYGAHFQGSLSSARIRARFGSLGSVALHFVPDGKARSRPLGKNCEGRRQREEDGHFVGHIDLRGEGGYFQIATRRVGGYVNRTYRLRCRVKHAAPAAPPISLLEELALASPGIFFEGGDRGSTAMLGARERQGHREVYLTARHAGRGRPGAEVTAFVVENQAKMPVLRSAFALESPAGTLLTSLPGEHPATATLKPGVPFTGEATYEANSELVHSWTGDLAVQFPGLLQPLAGPEFFSTLCVASLLRSRYGCDDAPPNWEPSE